MNESRSYLNQTIEDLRAQLQGKLAQVRKDLEHINYLEEMAGESLTRLDALAEGLGALDSSGGAPSPNQSGQERRSISTLQVRVDEFLGQDPLKAAKDYMRRVKRAVGIEELAKALEDGGAAVSGTDWRAKLDMALTRSVRDVVKVREGTFGLKELYTEEQLRGLRASRKGHMRKPGKK